jgi:hypothetical protein
MADVAEQDRRHAKKRDANQDRPRKHASTAYREIPWSTVQRALLPPLSVEGIFNDPESARQWVDAQPASEEDRYSVDQIELDEAAQAAFER